MSTASINVSANVHDTTTIGHMDFPRVAGERPEFVSVEIGSSPARIVLLVTDPDDLDRLIEVCKDARRFLVREAARRSMAGQPDLLADLEEVS